MKLKEYLIKYRMKPEEFAIKHHFATTTIYRCVKGKKMGFNTAKRIEQDTKGEVSFEEVRCANESSE